MKAYWRVEVQFHAFLTSTLDGDEWSASPPGKEPRHPLDRRLDGAHSQTGRGDDNSQPLLGLEPTIIQAVALYHL